MIKWEYLYGLHPVRLAIEGGKRKLKQLLVYDNHRNVDLKKLIEIASAHGLPVQYTTKYELNRLLPDATHQNAVLQSEPIRLEESQSITALREPLVLGLEGVRDPHNLGSIIRTCAFYGVPLVVDNECSQLSPIVSKSSAGAFEILHAQGKIHRTQKFSSLSHDRIMIASVCTPEKGNCPPLSPGKRYLLMMGSEGDGLKQRTLERCELFTHIAGNFPSLNVSVATGILLHSLLFSK